MPLDQLGDFDHASCPSLHSVPTQSALGPSGKPRQGKTHHHVNRGDSQGKLDRSASALSQDRILLGQFDQRDHRANRRVLEECDEVVGHRRDHDPNRLRNDHATKCHHPRHTQGQGSFHLTSGNRLQPCPIDLRLISGIVDRKAGDTRNPGRQLEQVKEHEKLEHQRRARGAARHNPPGSIPSSRGP